MPFIWKHLYNILFSIIIRLKVSVSEILWPSVDLYLRGRGVDPLHKYISIYIFTYNFHPYHAVL